MTSLPSLDGFTVLPGLINAHDHLEFGLFPRLGRGPYPDAESWARDIYHPDQAPVSELLKIPKCIRMTWGGLRNLLSGVTTVCHHNPYSPRFDGPFPVRVVKNYGWAHSLAFASDVAAEYRKTPRTWPFLIHCAEGTTPQSRAEIRELQRLKALTSRTVLVHAVALDRAGIAMVRAAGASVIWCPSSNQFLLGRSLPPPVFRSGIPIALATDSSMTACGDLLDELRFAAQCVSPDTLYEMVTSNPRRILRLRETKDDLTVFRDEGLPPGETLLRADLEMVIIGGRIQLASEAAATRLPRAALRRFRRIAVEDRGIFLVDRASTRDCWRAQEILAAPLRIGGKRVSPA